MPLLIILFILFATQIHSAPEHSLPCHPPINAALPQYIIGYGSLMQEASKNEEDAHSSKIHPIYLTGFKRSWIKRGSQMRFNTTYLGITPHLHSKINAVYFQLSKATAIYRYDKRENDYCRINISPQHIQFLTPKPNKKGQYWIYTLPLTEKAQPPDQTNPIVQSYVDIFLSGCLQLESKCHLPHFAQDCIHTTSNWSTHWVNDRLYPRRSYEIFPDNKEVDLLVAKELPRYFNAIKIE